MPIVVFGWAGVETARHARDRSIQASHISGASTAADALDQYWVTHERELSSAAARFPLGADLRSGARRRVREGIRRIARLVQGSRYLGIVYHDEVFAEDQASVRESLNLSEQAIVKLAGGDRRVLQDAPGARAGIPLVVTLPIGDSGEQGHLLEIVDAPEVVFRPPSYDPSRESFAIVQTDTGYVVTPRDAPRDADLIRAYRAAGRSSSGGLATDAGRDQVILGGFATAAHAGYTVILGSRERKLAGLLGFIWFPPAHVAIVGAMALLAMIVTGRALAREYNLKQAQASRLQAQRSELSRTVDVKSEFIANVSHDLWTPLAGIQLSVSSLLDPSVEWTPQQARQHLRVASIGLSRMSNRVRNLLEMARLESGTETSPKEPCDLSDLVNSAREQLEPLLEGRKITLDFPDNPLMFYGRYAQIETVLMNLLENAVKYSPPGSPLLMHGGLKGDYVQFSLRDCGPGVNPEDATRIFDKFFRAQPMHHLGGTGLGLAICKSIIEAHGGLIGVMGSAGGGGAEFWFAIPEMGAGEDPRL